MLMISQGLDPYDKRNLPHIYRYLFVAHLTYYPAIEAIFKEHSNK